jgi:hypothetical protein
MYEGGRPTYSGYNPMKKQVAIMITQGTNDTSVNPTMGQASPAFWTGQYGCSTTTSTSSSLSGCVDYMDCPTSLPAYYCPGNW